MLSRAHTGVASTTTAEAEARLRSLRIEGARALPVAGMDRRFAERMRAILEGSDVSSMDHAQVRSVFRRYDTGASGEVTLADFRRSLRELGITFTPNDMEVRRASCTTKSLCCTF